MSGLWKKYEEKTKAKRDMNTKRKAESKAENAKKARLQAYRQQSKAKLKNTPELGHTNLSRTRSLISP
jgi:hypothetical protein